MAAIPSAKRQALKALRELRDDVSREELLRTLYIRLLVEDRLREAQTTPGLSTRQVRHRLRRWLAQ